jgi:hypothetical protein
MLAAVALALLQPAAPAPVPAPAQERRQEGGNIMGPYEGVQKRAGPLHFCARFVAIEVAADEKIAWQEGPDFDLYFLQSSSGGFGMYEGNHPQQGGASESVTVSGLSARRQREANGGYSYLVQIPDVSFPTFVHLYGAAWQGDDRDLPLLARVKIGQPAAIGCERPTFQRR